MVQDIKMLTYLFVFVINPTNTLEMGIRLNAHLSIKENQ